MKTLVIVLVLMTSMAVLPVQAQGTEEGPPSGLVPSAFDVSVAGVDSLPNLSTGLSQLFRGWQSGKPVTELAQAISGVEVSDDRVMVMLIMLDEAAAHNAIAALPLLGGELIVSFQTWIDAWVPVAALADLAALPGIGLVREPVKVFPLAIAPSERQLAEMLSAQAPNSPEAGPVETQGVQVSNAHVWHAAGWKGQGVKVALLDNFGNYPEAQARGELPANIQAYSPSYSPIWMTNPHGTACAEIIYDMAPGVQFTFASPRTATSMAALIRELAQLGNRIISSSYGWVGLEPGDGSGPLNDAIRWAYEQKGTLYVQAAGNMRQFHWDGRFKDSNGDLWHEFPDGGSINWFSTELPVGTVLDAIYLRWNSWWRSFDDFDLYLVRHEPTTGQVVNVKWSAIRQTGTQPPYEAIEGHKVDTKGWYGIAVRRVSGRTDAVLDLGGYGLPPFTNNQPARSLIDAARSPYAFTVAAVDVKNFQQEQYSSEGPTHGAGGSLGTGYFKPNIAGYANVNTWAYGNFRGTSSATPHVAGAAAVVLGAYPQSHAYHIWNHLVSFAIDRGAAGNDYQYGTGMLRMMTPAPTSGGGAGQAPGQCPDCAPRVGYKLYLPLVVR